MTSPSPTQRLRRGADSNAAKENVWDVNGKGSFLDGFGHSEKTGMSSRVHPTVSNYAIHQQPASSSQHPQIAQGSPSRAFHAVGVVDAQEPTSRREEDLLAELTALREEHRAMEASIVHLENVALQQQQQPPPAVEKQFDANLFGDNARRQARQAPTRSVQPIRGTGEKRAPAVLSGRKQASVARQTGVPRQYGYPAAPDGAAPYQPIRAGGGGP